MFSVMDTTRRPRDLSAINNYNYSNNLSVPSTPIASYASEPSAPLRPSGGQHKTSTSSSSSSSRSYRPPKRDVDLKTRLRELATESSSLRAAASSLSSSGEVLQTVSATHIRAQTLLEDSVLAAGGGENASLTSRRKTQPSLPAMAAAATPQALHALDMLLAQQGFTFSEELRAIRSIRQRLQNAGDAMQITGCTNVTTYLQARHQDPLRAPVEEALAGSKDALHTAAQEVLAMRTRRRRAMWEECYVTGPTPNRSSHSNNNTTVLSLSAMFFSNAFRAETSFAAGLSACHKIICTLQDVDSPFVADVRAHPRVDAFENVAQLWHEMEQIHTNYRALKDTQKQQQKPSSRSRSESAARQQDNLVDRDVLAQATVDFLEKRFESFLLGDEKNNESEEPHIPTSDDVQQMVWDFLCNYVTESPTQTQHAFFCARAGRWDAVLDIATRIAVLPDGAMSVLRKLAERTEANSFQDVSSLEPLSGLPSQDPYLAALLMLLCGCVDQTVILNHLNDVFYFPEDYVWLRLVVARRSHTVAATLMDLQASVMHQTPTEEDTYLHSKMLCYVQRFDCALQHLGHGIAMPVEAVHLGIVLQHIGFLDVFATERYNVEREIASFLAETMLLRLPSCLESQAPEYHPAAFVGGYLEHVREESRPHIITTLLRYDSAAANVLFGELRSNYTLKKGVVGEALLEVFLVHALSNAATMQIVLRVYIALIDCSSKVEDHIARFQRSVVDVAHKFLLSAVAGSNRGGGMTSTHDPFFGGAAPWVEALLRRIPDEDIRVPLYVLLRCYEITVERKFSVPDAVQLLAEELLPLPCVCHAAAATSSLEPTSILSAVLVAVNDALLGVNTLAERSPEAVRLMSGLVVVHEAYARLRQLESASHLSLIPPGVGLLTDASSSSLRATPQNKKMILSPRSSDSANKQQQQQQGEKRQTTGRGQGQGIAPIIPTRLVSVVTSAAATRSQESPARISGAAMPPLMIKQ
eukprot:PhM_4_TR9320/c0_g1_i1/m.20839